MFYVAMERPTFGQFARKIAPVKLDDLAACIQQQKMSGGRMGDLLVQRGLLDRSQVNDILRMQAEWVADSFKQEMGDRMPYPESVSVCMPAYNEAENLPDTLDAALNTLPSFLTKFEIVVVNDGSKDATAAVVGEYAARDPRVRLVNHERNKGYGAAVSSGLRAATGDLVMFCDSDGQFSFLDLPHLLRQMADHDVVVGYRYNRADTFIRKFNARCWNWLVNLVLGVPVRDLDCAFKLFRKPILDRLQLNSTGAAINAEIMVQVLRGGVRLSEVPVSHFARVAGSPTGAAYKVILKAFRELPKLWKHRVNAQSLVPVAAGQAAPQTQTDTFVPLPSDSGTHPLPNEPIPAEGIAHVQSGRWQIPEPPAGAKKKRSR